MPGQHPEDRLARELQLFRRGGTVGLSQVQRIPGSGEKQPTARLLLECLKNREDDVLRFLTDLRIPPTSNQAERGRRPAPSTPEPRLPAVTQNNQNHVSAMARLLRFFVAVMVSVVSSWRQGA